MKLSKDEHIVVYTINLNEYDQLPAPSPPTNDFDVEFLLFTDKDVNISGWKTIKVPVGGRRASRFEKINSHLIDKYCSEIPVWTIYLDCCLELSNNWLELLSNEELKDGYNICKHKDSIYQHIKRMIGLSKESIKDDLKVQMLKYQSEGMPDYFPVTENCLIIRRNTEDVEIFNELWWFEYTITSERDQPSLSYVSWKYNQPINFLSFEARKNNVYSNWCRHKSKNKQRSNDILERQRNVFMLKEKKEYTEPQLIEIKRDIQPKICVCTINVGTGNQILDYCIPTIKYFANKNNYDFYEITDNDIKYPHPSWLRLKLRDVIPNYDGILYIDGDICILPTAKSPIDYYRLDGITALDSYSHFRYMRSYPTQRQAKYSQKWKQTFNEKCPLEFPTDRYINAGVMIIPNGFENFLNDPPRILSDENFYEQTYLNCQSMKYNYYNLNRRWNWGHIQVNTRDNMNYILEKKMDFIHFNVPQSVKIKTFELYRDFLSRNKLYI